MKEIIEALDLFIKDTQIITNWGGWCENRPPETGKVFPYGLNPITNKNKSNIYSYDDNHLCSGYLFISNVRNRVSGSARNAILVTITIHVFTNIKKNGDITATFNRPLSLFGMLSKKYKNIRFNTPLPNRYQEFASIEIDIEDFAPCTFTSNESCEC